MPTIERSALLPYSAQQMFALINDVAAYPQFMDGCVGVQIFHQDETMMQARLDLEKAGLQYSFTTRNTLMPPQKIMLALVDGPFNDFAGQWSIDALSDNACKVSLCLQFTLSGALLGLAAKTVFTPLADNLVNAMVKRAHQLYK